MLSAGCIADPAAPEPVVVHFGLWANALARQPHGSLCASLPWQHARTDACATARGQSPPSQVEARCGTNVEDGQWQLSCWIKHGAENGVVVDVDSTD